MLCPGAPEKCCSVQWLILWKQGIPPLSFQTVQNKLRPYPWILSGKGGTGNKIFPLEKNEAIVHTPYIFWSIFSSFLIPSFLKLWFPGHTGRGLNEDGCKSHVPTLLKKKKKKGICCLRQLLTCRGFWLFFFTGFLSITTLQGGLKIDFELQIWGLHATFQD